MSEEPTTAEVIPAPSDEQIARAIRLSNMQAMLGAVFGASTGGMFLIGFAMALGASNVWLGLMSTIPQFFVVFQVIAAYMVESGISRRKLTVTFGLITPLCWFFIAAIPLFGARMDTRSRIGLLIGVIVLVTISSQFAGNARGSWIGDLIPAKRRGRFWGRLMMFAGIIGAAFAIIEGRFLDFIISKGLYAFTALFFFGALFGVAAAYLHIPQPDCPLPGGGIRVPFRTLVRDTFRNKPFMMLALTHVILAFGNICGPFVTAYSLRDVGVSFFGLGLLNSAATAASLIFSPLWGKMIDKVGCRPVLIFGLLVMAPCSLVWLFIPPHSARMAYCLLPWSNFIAGCGSSATSVAISTMTYKLSEPRGRSVQFALYSVFVTIISAPMPFMGGWLVTTLQHAGRGVDLRLTFYLWSFFVLAAAVAAKFLKEPDSVSTGTFVKQHLPEAAGELLSKVRRKK